MVQQYLDHCKAILTSPYTLVKGGSKEVPLVSLFGYQNEYDLREGFPLLTTKKMAIKSITHELIWFMRGETNIKYLVDNKVPLWTRDGFNHNYKNLVREGIFSDGLVKYSPDWEKAVADYEQRIREDSEFAQKYGDLGPVYGAQWRNWKSVGKDGEVVKVDQLSKLIEILKNKPTSKKNVLTAWNPGDLSRMALEPCHMFFQVNSDSNILDLQMYQRSCDQFLGVPLNIASYAMLTQIIAQETKLEPRRLIHTFGDSHFYCGTGKRGIWYKENLNKFQDMVSSVKELQDYLNVLEDLNKLLPPEAIGEEGYDHVTAIIEQLSRTPKQLPRLEIADKPFDKLTIDDFILEDYDHDPQIKRKMAV